jgi:hypothetical protein
MLDTLKRILNENMAVLGLSPNPCARSCKLVLTKTLGSGRLVYQALLNAYDPKSQHAAATACDVDLQVILDLLQDFQQGARPATRQVPDPDALPTGQIEAVLRGLRQPATQGQVWANEDPLALLDELLAVTDYPVPEPVVEWHDERLVLVDADHHDRPLDQRPAPHQLENLAARAEPAPPRYHVSHGLGLHLYYVAREGYSALDLAAAAAVWLKQADPTAGVELKRSTRHPAYPRADGRTAGPVRAQEATADLSGLRAWLRRDVGAGAVQEWLEQNGLAPGGRYPHTSCPLRPGEPSHGEPVFVGEHGIHCQHCASRGLRQGSRTPGFVPYAVLLNAGLSPLIRRLVRSRTHWEHAQVVLAAQYGLSGDIARHAYRALLRLEHDRDPAVARVFSSGADLVRLPGRWATADGATTYKVQYLAHLLGRLPACQFPDGRPDPERVDRFRQPSDLTEFGYPAITLLRGCRVYSQHLDFDDPGRITAVAPGELLRPESMAPYRPRYLRPSQRMSLDRAWEVYERYFPSLVRNFLLLQIAAKGVSEGAVGLPPMILVVGPSGAAKSATVTLAAATCGDNSTEVVWTGSPERFRQAVKAGIDAGGFVSVHEFLKDALRAGLSPVEALDPILTLTPSSTSHVLYLGPVALGRLPAFTLTDIYCPQEVRDDVQLARRLLYVRLPSRVDWEAPLTQHAGGRGIEAFRTFGQDEADAANALLGHVIDRYFQRPMTLREIAADLGYTTLEDSDDFDDPRELMRRFFDLVCAAPDRLNDADRRRWRGRGWKKVQRHEETELADLWRQLADGEGEDYTRSRRCREMDWGRLLGRPGLPITFEVAHSSHSTVAVRFKLGNHATYKVNEECLTHEVLQVVS